MGFKTKGQNISMEDCKDRRGEESRVNEGVLANEKGGLADEGTTVETLSAPPIIQNLRGSPSGQRKAPAIGQTEGLDKDARTQCEQEEDVEGGGGGAG